MKNLVTGIQILISIIIVISLANSFIEYDIAKRRLTFDQQIFPSGKSYYEDKSKNDIITEKQTFNERLHELSRYRLIGNSSIVLLFILLYYTQRVIRKK